MINHYQILNISENATIEEIKIAYRKLAILYHPDKNKNIDANQKFVKIKNSYDVLLDPIKRKKFDKELEIQRLQSKIYNELNKKTIKLNFSLPLTLFYIHNMDKISRIL